MKLAILLPEGYDLSCLRKARLLARAAQAGYTLTGAPVSVAFGLPQPAEKLWRQHEAYLTEGLDNVVAHHLVWERVSASNAARMYPQSRRQLPLGLKKVTVPRDWGANFLDCDIWFNLADPAMGGIFTHRPTAHFCSDLSSRRYPLSFARNHEDYRWEAQTAAFQLWRSDAVIVAGDEETARDLTSFAGVYPDKVMLVPGLSRPPDLLAAPEREPSATHLLWRMGPCPETELYNALKGLKIYLDEGGALRVRVLSEASAAKFGKGLPIGIREFARSLPVAHLFTDYDLTSWLRRGAGVWTTRIAGGEASAVAEGYAAGLPVMAVDTPAHRSWVERLDKNLVLYPANSPLAVTNALLAMEVQCCGTRSGIGLYPQPASPADDALVAQHIGFVIDRLGVAL